MNPRRPCYTRVHIQSPRIPLERQGLWTESHANPEPHLTLDRLVPCLSHHILAATLADLQ